MTDIDRIKRISQVLFDAKQMEYEASAIDAPWAGTDARRRRDQKYANAFALARSVDVDISALPQPIRWAMSQALTGTLRSIRDSMSKA